MQIAILCPAEYEPEYKQWLQTYYLKLGYEHKRVQYLGFSQEEETGKVTYDELNELYDPLHQLVACKAIIMDKILMDNYQKPDSTTTTVQVPQSTASFKTSTLKRNNKKHNNASYHTSAATAQASSPFDKTATTSNTTTKKIKGKKQRAFVPRKAAVELTDSARTFFQKLLANPPRPDIIGIQLCYGQSSTGQPRMVFSFRFVTQADLGPMDEGVSLEVLEDGTPNPPAEAANDGLPKLYVQGDAFLKVLGATVDVDQTNITPILYDKEGNKMDPNA
jgi:hypothetical protein